MSINVPVAEQSGVSVTDILNTMQGYIGGIYAADFTKYGKQFRGWCKLYQMPENLLKV